MMNESELASVLGHEIGHVTARHSVSMMSRAQLAQIGLVLGQIAVPELGAVGDVAGAGMQLLFLHYGRDAERQSDELGFRYAHAQGYDVGEMADIFRSLERMGSRQDRSALPSWLASHPGEEERIENAEARVRALPTPPDTARRGTDAYLSQVKQLVYGENPRNGFFRDGRFYHPEMRFQLEFPSGWATQNLSQAVVAGSPQQDAVLQLTLAPAAGAATAARTFLSQQGIQTVQTSRETVQGNPAVVGLFQAQTEQGVVEGIATWIDYGGRTYQLLGYAPGGRLRAHIGTLREAIGSFRSLDDPQILAVQPSRLDVVRIDRAMTLEEFNRRYPSGIDIDELAIINQVDGPATRLPAGALVKRVTPGGG
jgi:predicted Zn-dependent protease